MRYGIYRLSYIWMSENENETTQSFTIFTINKFGEFIYKVSKYRITTHRIWLVQKICEILSSLIFILTRIDVHITHIDWIIIFVLFSITECDTMM